MESEYKPNPILKRLERSMHRRRGIFERKQEEEQERRTNESCRQEDENRTTTYRESFPALTYPAFASPAIFFPSQGAPVTSPQWPPVVYNTSRNTKTEFIDLMMMQNAQLHQLTMQQMMLSAIPPAQTRRQENDGSNTYRKTNAHLGEFLQLLLEKRKSDRHPKFIPCAMPPITLFSTPLMKSYESPPLRPPRVVSSNPPRKLFLPFPGPLSLRRFRRAGWAVLFTKFLKPSPGKRRYPHLPMLGRNFIFGIRLRESLSAIHRILLNRENGVYRLLRRIVEDNRLHLTVVLDSTDGNDYGPTNERNEKTRAYRELADIIESVAYAVTQIMPSKGVLGTNRKSTIYKMIQPNQTYPKGYFWAIEKRLLKVDSLTESMHRITDVHGFILLIGHFLGRAIIQTLLLKPGDSRLLGFSFVPGQNVKQNLRLLASLLTYLLRKLYASFTQLDVGLLAPSIDFERHLFDDRQLRIVLNNLQKSFNYAEKLLKSWATEYIERLRSVR